MSNPTGFLSPITQGIFGGPNPNQPAPTINPSAANAWQGDPSLAGQNQTDEEKAKQLALQTAQGTGPSAATELLKQQTGAAQGAANAVAASGSGTSGQGIARRNATMAGAGALQTLGAQAATARAQEQLGGESLYGTEAAGARGQDLAAAGQQAGLATAQGQIAEQQNQTNAEAAGANASANAGTFQTLAAMGAGAALLADGQVGGQPSGGARVGTSIFKEPTTADARHAPGAPPPGQEAEWVLREQDNFLMAENKRTGQKFKVAMQHLSPAEERQVQAPHGAGPIDGPDSQRIHSQMADGDVGGDQRFAEMVRRAHPGLYRAATTKTYGDADAGGGASSASLAVNLPSRPSAGDVSRAQSDLGSTGEYGYQPFYGQGAPASDPNAGSDWGQADALAAGHEDVINSADRAHRGDTIAASAPDDRAMGVRGAIGGALLGLAGGPSALARVIASRRRPQRPGADEDGGDTKTYGDGDVTMGPVTEEPNDDGGGIEKTRTVERKPLQGRDYASLKKAGDTRAAETAPEPFNRGTADQGAPIRDPYRNLPQGPALRPQGSARSGDFRDVAADRLKSDLVNQEFPSIAPKQPQEWETAEPKHQARDTKPGAVPANYSDGDMGGSALARMGIGRKGGQHADADLDDQRHIEDTDTETQSARQAYNEDVGRARRELDENEHPDEDLRPDIDRSARAAFDRDIDFTRRELDEPNDADPSLPIDIDDPMAVWDYEARQRRAHDDAQDVAWMEAHNPYEQASAPRPRLAALFPVRKAQAPSKAGPVDWMAALHEKNVAYDRAGGLAQDPRWRQLLRDFADPAPSPSPRPPKEQREANREEYAYRDGDLRRGKSALSRSVKRKPKKKAAA